MKTLPLAFALLFAAPVMAEEKEPDFCTQVATFAENVHKIRNNGASLARSLEIAGDGEITREIVIDLYDRPRYSTDEYIERDRRAFADKWHLACIRGTK